MGLTTAELNAAADSVASRLDWFSLHTADPGVAGDNEVTGGTPAYARMDAVWDPAAAGVAALDAALDFNVPAGTTVAYVGFWSAETGGTFRGSKALASPESFTNQGVFHLTVASVTVDNG